MRESLRKNSLEFFAPWSVAEVATTTSEAKLTVARPINTCEGPSSVNSASRVGESVPFAVAVVTLRSVSGLILHDPVEHSVLRLYAKATA